MITEETIIPQDNHIRKLYYGRSESQAALRSIKQQSDSVTLESGTTFQMLPLYLNLQKSTRFALCE